MPSASSSNFDRQSHPGPSPLSQSPKNAVADQSAPKSSRKKGKKLAEKKPTIIDTEDSPSDGVQPSPPQPPAHKPRGRFTDELFIDDDVDPPEPEPETLDDPVDEADNDTAYDPNGWRNSIPIGASPPVKNTYLRPVSGSPPVAHKFAERGGFASASPPVSPPQRKSRPVSYGGHGVGSRRPSSEKSNRYGTSPLAQPPLPHLPQPHFYGTPDLNLGLGDWVNSRAKDDTVHFTAFDRVHTSLKDGKTASQDYLLVGSAGRLEITSLVGEKSQSVGSLVDLPGDVIGATLLPAKASPQSASGVFPLVVVITHGPKLDDEDHRQQYSGSSDGSDAVVADRQHPQYRSQAPQPDYQTRVDVYSLTTQERVATLFVSQPSPASTAFRGLPASPPSPIGELSLAVHGKYVVLSSGTSGEVYVFTAMLVGFQCLAKFWTTVQRRDLRKYSTSSGSADSDASPADPHRGQLSCPIPLVTISGRWLALVPPSSPSRPSINGYVPTSLVQNRVPGLHTLNAPAKPPATCIIESPDAESMLNKVARGVAKEVVKGARWLGEQGLQTWNNYWNQNASPPQTASPNNRLSQPQEQFYPSNVFPPTHAPDVSTPSDEPEMVSVIDLLHLEQKVQKAADNVAPVATFQPPGGCSFLSFSPVGLSLLTATRKGDIQYIWDLMQISHARIAGLVSNDPTATDTDSAHTSPRVRQIAKYARLSSSSIVDVIWTDPLGDRFAMLTRNGTVHVFDLPHSAFQWPPPRRAVRPQPHSPSLAPAGANEADLSGGVFASAMKFASKTQPIFSTLRGRTPSVGNTLGGMGGASMGLASATGVRGGKAVAVGLSKSVGAASDTVSHLRHAGENRVHLNSLARDPRPGRIIWSHSTNVATISILDEDCVRVYKLKRREVAGRQSQRAKVSVIDARRPREITIPSVQQVSGTDIGYSNFQSSPQKQMVSAHAQHPLSRAEIETNAPYQPFHSDKRVNLCIYRTAYAGEPNLMGDSFTSSRSQLLNMASKPPPMSTKPSSPTRWVFGDDILTTKITVRAPADSYSEHEDSSAALGAVLGSTIIRQAHPPPSDGSDPIEQIVITTRRKKGRPVGGGANSAKLGDLEEGNELIDDGDDGFFEDDCEVLDWAGDRV